MEGQVTEQQEDQLAEQLVGFHKLLETASDEQLGRALRVYVQESEHSNWEGFTMEDLMGFAKVASDLALAVDHGLLG